MDEKKDPVLCYIHFMYNEWSEDMAKQVFADTFCGWQYLWQKWLRYRETYGYNGAIMKYYSDGLDSELQRELLTFAERFYNGPK